MHHVKLLKKPHAAHHAAGDHEFSQIEQQMELIGNKAFEVGGPDPSYADFVDAVSALHTNIIFPTCRKV
jgi:hypothetical protein